MGDGQTDEEARMRSDGCHSMRVSAALSSAMGRDGLHALGSSKQGAKGSGGGINGAP